MDRSVKPLRNYINGEFLSPSVETGVWLEDPNTREALQKQMASDDASIEKALSSAQRVHVIRDYFPTPFAKFILII